MTVFLVFLCVLACITGRGRLKFCKRVQYSSIDLQKKIHNVRGFVGVVFGHKFKVV